jgi:type I restriction enzyme S subunit
MKTNWQTKKLGDICEYISRGISPKYIDNGGIFVLNQKCIRNHVVSYTEAKRHDNLTKNIANDKLIQIGDVLVNSTGVGTLGRVAQIKILEEPTIVDSHITIVRPFKNIFRTHFFGWAMIYVEDLIKGMGEGASGQTELSRTTLKEIKISYPESLSEQQQIVDKLDALSAETKKLEAIYKQKLAALEELKKSLLQKAFNGEL